jgi:NAD+ synthase (glutamine-hydrolysing)
VIGIPAGSTRPWPSWWRPGTLDHLARPRHGHLAVTMPGFGTTERTLANARSLMERLGVEKPGRSALAEACLRHFADIGHDPAVRDTTYENVQARERTQILMDLANAAAGGLVVGTETSPRPPSAGPPTTETICPCTRVNCSVPKTLVKHLVVWGRRARDGQGGPPPSWRGWWIRDQPGALAPTRTAPSPRRPEDLVGLRGCTIFFSSYTTCAGGSSPDKILFLAGRAFAGAYDEARIQEVGWRFFYRRFFAQQFKGPASRTGPRWGPSAFPPGRLADAERRAGPALAVQASTRAAPAPAARSVSGMGLAAG